MGAVPTLTGYGDDVRPGDRVRLTRWCGGTRWDEDEVRVTSWEPERTELADGRIVATSDLVLHYERWEGEWVPCSCGLALVDGRRELRRVR